jgi:hypothetical protein
MTDYEALKRALRLIGFDFNDVILHDGRRSVLVASPEGGNSGPSLSSLAWHFDYDTEEYIGSFAWNRSESLGFDEDGSPACCCEECREMKERIRKRWGD